MRPLFRSSLRIVAVTHRSMSAVIGYLNSFRYIVINMSSCTYHILIMCSYQQYVLAFLHIICYI